MAGSLIGNFTRPVPSCITFDIRAEYSVVIVLSSKCTSCVNPIVSAKNRTHFSIAPSSTLPTMWSTALSRPTPSNCDAVRAGRAEPRRKRPYVIVALDKLDERVAIEREWPPCAARPSRRCDSSGWHRRLGAARRRLAERRCRVGHLQRDDADTVAMPSDEFCRGVIGTERAGEHEPDVALLEHVGGHVAGAGFEASIRGPVEAETRFVEDRRLPGVADEELEVIDAFDRAEVAHASSSRLMKPLWPHLNAYFNRNC